MIRYVLLIALVLLKPVACLGARTTIQPTDLVVASGPTGSTGGLVLLKFPIPEEAANGKVTRAVLEFTVDCQDEPIVIWCHPAPSDWDSGSDTGSWWAANRDSLEEYEIVHFESPECNQGLVQVDVARWVRAWARGQKENHGLLFRQPPGATGLADMGLKVGAPVQLRITFRERKSNR